MEKRKKSAAMILGRSILRVVEDVFSSVGIAALAPIQSQAEVVKNAVGVGADWGCVDDERERRDEDAAENTDGEDESTLGIFRVPPSPLLSVAGRGTPALPSPRAKGHCRVTPNDVRCWHSNRNFALPNSAEKKEPPVDVGAVVGLRRGSSDGVEVGVSGKCRQRCEGLDGRVQQMKELGKEEDWNSGVDVWEEERFGFGVGVDVVVHVVAEGRGESEGQVYLRRLRQRGTQRGGLSPGLVPAVQCCCFHSQVHGVEFGYVETKRF